MNNHRRWSDHDHYWGPFTYAHEGKSWKNFRFDISSGDGDEDAGCRLRISLLGHTLLTNLPAIIKPRTRQVPYSIPGQEGKFYTEHDERVYGMYLFENHFNISYGPQKDSWTRGEKEYRWSCFLPWNEWRHVRHSYYGLDGEHYWTEPQGIRPVLTGATVTQQGMTWEEKKKIEDACPSRTFRFSDFDGEKIECKTCIEEREWHKGNGYFKWLRFFVKPKISRSLDLDFSKEIGRRKGSWKGGTTGHSIEMLPGELHEAAFKRYCEGEDSRAGKKRDMKFIGEVV